MTIVTPLESAAGSDERKSAAHRAIDRALIAEVLKTEYGGLLGLVRRKLGNRELAADLVNEAIAVTLEHAESGRLTEQERIGGYVFKVSMNLLRNYQRNSDNRSDLRTGAEGFDSLAVRDRDDLETADLSRMARRLIESLASARDREVVKRFYLDEEDKQTICDAVGLTSLQFTQIMSRARQRMKVIFESQGLKRSDFFSLLL